MSVSITSTGLSIDTYQEIFSALLDSYANVFDITDIQKERLRNNLESPAANLLRIMAEQIYRTQETLLEVYNAQGFGASGAALDKVVDLLGVTRIGEVVSECEVTATGLNGTVIPDGVRASSSEDSTIWTVVDGPYTIVGTTATVTLQCSEAGAVEVDGATEWTILDVLAGLTSFTAATQTITGNDAETDAELRTRARQEAYRRGSTTFEAVEAAVAEVEGVTYVKCYQNDTDATDAYSVPPHSIWVITEGGAAAAVREAISTSKPAGITAYGSESAAVDLGSGRNVTIGFDYVSDVNVDITVDLVSSTSEEFQPADLTTQVGAALQDYMDSLEIGQDVLPYRLIGAIYAAGITGVDSVSLTLRREAEAFAANVVRMDPFERAVANVITVNPPT